MSRITEFKRCRCGYSILVLSSGKKYYIFIDGHSGNYEQVDSCPGCKDALDYLTLEG